MRRGTAVRAVAAVVLLTTSACSSADDVRFGAEDAGDARDQLCVPAGADEQIATGGLITAGAEDITITDVALVDPSNLELGEALLLPVEGSVGSAPYPPTDLPGWEERREARGSTVPAQSSGALVVALSRPAGDVDGSTDSLRVTYTAAGQERQRTNTTSVQLTTVCF